MANTTNTVLLSFGGIVLGFILSQAADFIKFKRDEKVTKKSVRKLISLEIKKNYRLLAIFWREVDSSFQREQENDKETSLSTLGHQLIIHTFPNLSRKAWEGHLEKVAESFSHEEISRIWDYYEDIQQLETIYEKISSVKQLSATTRKENTHFSKMFSNIEFQQKAESQISNFKLIIEGIVKYNKTENILSR